MNYWWVNHKQTFKKELVGGYIWSPLRSANSHNQTYSNLTLAKVGDVIFSFANALTKAIGIVEAECVASKKPPEFGSFENWSKDGYLVSVNWVRLWRPFKPKDYINKIRPFLPEVNSPIRPDGNGNQGCYLAAISQEFGELMMLIAEGENSSITSIIDQAKKDSEEDAAQRALEDDDLPELEKRQLVKARVGQGIYRQRLLEVERACRVTGLSDARFLIASHMKPWKDCTNKEKLDGHNGLLLSPHVDKLFDKLFMTFDKSGKIIYSDKEIEDLAVKKWGLRESMIGKLDRRQLVYLDYHRESFYSELNFRKT